MTESTPDQILARAQVPSSNGRPIRKDEIELHDRGVYIESWLPERRSRRKPLLFVHGELAGSWLWERDLGYFASRGWEGHAVNLQNHFWSRTSDPTELTFQTYVDDVVAALIRLGPSTVVIGHGMGGLLALKAAEQAAMGGLVLLSPEPPAGIRPPAEPHELREIPAVYGRGQIGWATLPETLTRDHRELTIADVPRLVIGAGLDRTVPEPLAERVAQWLGAQYEPFGAHSHYGLVVGEQSHQQVADAIRG